LVAWYHTSAYITLPEEKWDYYSIIEQIQSYDLCVEIPLFGDYPFKLDGKGIIFDV
jgi:hypothetical protein